MVGRLENDDEDDPLQNGENGHVDKRQLFNDPRNGTHVSSRTRGPLLRTMALNPLSFAQRLDLEEMAPNVSPATAASGPGPSHVLPGLQSRLRPLDQDTFVDFESMSPLEWMAMAIHGRSHALDGNTNGSLVPFGHNYDEDGDSP
ncbi:uncharacterized protein A1O5_10479 [Cladophialophora psammophila CBS 110553]|uniref:Uncharacterized protein n=1 Tax=Cladophialophora psammophila CBS 110553 TaxID=1182543 RepID=W9WE18_9EURO|nr:uncharacterized protein A1O5_10479 [Cladophialophora psammophila CBS 110553]EXJ66327.1 hypothetical protein A1O5_10479 [Cladophialophora psammophila CBS 110553]